MPVSNSTLSRTSLEDTARKICESRGGKWSGTKGMACCPAHDDRTPSLGVTLGRKAILFHCFAGCDQQSVLSAMAREGFEVTRFFSGSSAENQLKSPRMGKPSAAALRIWREAEPLGASPAKAYLESRGILAASSALRFHPQTPLGPKGRTRFLPAMIAAVSLDEGPIAIHRTFLSSEFSTKAAFDKPMGQGSLPLCPKASMLPPSPTHRTRRRCSSMFACSRCFARQGQVSPFAWPCSTRRRLRPRPRSPEIPAT